MKRIREPTAILPRLSMAATLTASAGALTLAEDGEPAATIVIAALSHSKNRLVNQCAYTSDRIGTVFIPVRLSPERVSGK